MWSNESFKCWLFLVGFTHLFFPASHRCVPSVSFVCLLKLPFCTKTYCAFQTFVPVLLVTPCVTSLCAPLEWLPQPGDLMGLGWFYCPQLNWQTCTEVACETTSSVLGRIFFYSDSILCKNFLGQRESGVEHQSEHCGVASTWQKEYHILEEITGQLLCWE